MKSVDWEKSFARIERKASDILDTFIKQYKVKLRAKRSKLAEGENTPNEIIDEDTLREFKSELMRTAREEDSFPVWMDTILNPNEGK